MASAAWMFKLTGVGIGIGSGGGGLHHRLLRMNVTSLILGPLLSRVQLIASGSSAQSRLRTTRAFVRDVSYVASAASSAGSACLIATSPQSTHCSSSLRLAQVSSSLWSVRTSTTLSGSFWLKKPRPSTLALVNRLMLTTVHSQRLNIHTYSFANLELKVGSKLFSAC